MGAAVCLPTLVCSLELENIEKEQCPFQVPVSHDMHTRPCACAHTVTLLAASACGMCACAHVRVGSVCARVCCLRVWYMYVRVHVLYMCCVCAVRSHVHVCVVCLVGAFYVRVCAVCSHVYCACVYVCLCVCACTVRVCAWLHRCVYS